MREIKMKKIVFAFLAVALFGSFSLASDIRPSGSGSSNSGSATSSDGKYTFNIGEVYASSTTYPFFYNQFFTLGSSITITSVRSYASYISTVSACNYDVVWSSTTDVGTRTWQSIFSTQTATGLVISTYSYIGNSIAPDFKATISSNSSIAPLFYNMPLTGVAPTVKIEVNYTK
jgi:hypothetical protein